MGQTVRDFAKIKKIRSFEKPDYTKNKWNKWVGWGFYADGVLEIPSKIEKDDY